MLQSWTMHWTNVVNLHSGVFRICATGAGAPGDGILQWDPEAEVFFCKLMHKVWCSIRRKCARYEHFNQSSLCSNANRTHDNHQFMTNIFQTWSSQGASHAPPLNTPLIMRTSAWTAIGGGQGRTVPKRSVDCGNWFAYKVNLKCFSGRRFTASMCNTVLLNS